MKFEGLIPIWILAALFQNFRPKFFVEVLDLNEGVHLSDGLRVSEKLGLHDGDIEDPTESLLVCALHKVHIRFGLLAHFLLLLYQARKRAAAGGYFRLIM